MSSVAREPACTRVEPNAVPMLLSSAKSASSIKIL